MTTFTIDSENNITAFAIAAEANSNTEAERFASSRQLNRLASKWPASRLVNIWNTLPGQKPVKKFASRDTAVARIWETIQTLVPDAGPQTAARPSPKMGAAEPLVATEEPARAHQGGTTGKVVELLRHPGGVRSPSSKNPGRQPAAQTKPVREGSKTAKVLVLLRRPGGATVRHIMTYASHCTSLA
jgi:hypothetical protein